MNMRRASLFLVVWMTFVASAAAHHGPGTFELDKTVTFTGATLVRVEVINPHSWLYFEATDESGRRSRHRCEMRSAHVLRRSGWTNDLFAAGQRMTITASPDRRDPNSCYLQTILFENGNRMDRYGQYVRGPEGAIREVRGPLVVPDVEKRALRRPGGEPNISGEWAPEQRVMIDPRGVGGGFASLSELREATPAPRGAAGRGGRAGGGRATGPRLYGGTELTALGERAAASFARDDNPRFRCETTSIVFDWTFDGPVNRITQNRDTIVIEYGQMNLERTIHMNLTGHPANVEPSRAGHSIGRWEGDVLVVDTVGFLPGVLSAPVRHGGQLHVVERFSLDPDTLKLTRAYTAEDPEYLKGRYTGTDMIQIADAPYTQDNCKEQGFIDFSERVP
jgi:hypothetical protein